MTDRLRIGLLGSLVVDASSGERLRVASSQQRRLLSILALEAGHILSADRLRELLECSSGSLRTTLSRLRASIGADHVDTCPPGYALMATTDITEFERLLADAAEAQGPSAIQLLDGALALWRGEAVEEFRDEFWTVPVVSRLDELHSAAIELRADKMVEEGFADRAIAEMTSHIARHPLRERPRAIVMRALAADGRTTEALRVYQQFRRYLADEAGTEPSDAIRSVERSITGGSTDSHAASDLTPVEQLTFLVTDTIEPISTPRLDPYEGSHDTTTLDELLSAVVTANHGVTIETGIGGQAAAFDVAEHAVAAAIEAQHSIGTTTWSTAQGPQVRMGIHLGTAVRRNDRWYGPTLDEAHRMSAVGHAGQIVASAVVASVIDTRLTDLGEHRLRDIEGVRRLFQVDVPGGPSRFPPLRSVGSFLTTLPAQRTSLIGRDSLVGRVRALIGRHRLVSLIGPGGVGKTRVAIEAAGQALGGFPGGVFFADLTRAPTEAGVAAEVLRSMRATVRPTQTIDDAISEFLAGRISLLVVDNCEHVVDRAADLIDNVLLAAPDTRVLTTSREPLQLHGERRLIVPSLGVDGASSPGVVLFADRAMANNEAKVVDDSDAETIGEIVRHLDGIPLAIELAAAQTATLTPSAILGLLDHRFELLTQRLRRVPPRQQTLAAAIDWSYDLLDKEEQRAFRILTTCSGAFSQETAERLLAGSAADAAQLVEALSAKSLLTTVRTGDDRRGYNFLETLREYGRSKSIEAGESAEADLALEHALIPTTEMLGDWTSLVNEYMCAADPSMMLENTTRLTCAARALEAGRLDHAALVFSSVAFRDEAGALGARAALVSPLADRRSELSPTAWLAASAARLLLERSARDYGACLVTAARVLSALNPEHPARSWFDVWRCALTTAIDPEAGIVEIDVALPHSYLHARPPLDWTLAQLLSTKATGLAILRRLEEADRLATEAAGWAPVGQESRDQVLALRVWFSYLRGKPMANDLARDIAGQAHDLGLAELCAAPGALCSGGTVEERAARLVAVARRRPKLDIPTPYLLAFAWLAIEEGDNDRARGLLSNTEMYDASTQVALLYALAAIDDWTPETWDRGRDAMATRYLSPEQEQAAKLGAATLDAEVENWERRLADRLRRDGERGPLG